MLFSGEMVVNNRRIPNPELSDEEKRKLYQLPKYKSDGIDHNQPFLFLTLDLPPKPLYVDPHKQISIPQVSFYPGQRISNIRFMVLGLNSLIAGHI